MPPKLSRQRANVCRACLCIYVLPDPTLLDRVQRLKDARTEASKEIEDYKRSKELEFKAFEDSVRRISYNYMPPP